MTEPLAVTAASSDAELISAVRSGDGDAYGILYQRHSHAARRVASHITPGPADLDDVVAETFVRVLAAIRRGGGPAEAFRPYLVTAARRVALDHLRGQRAQVPTDDAELPDPGEPFVDPAEASLERSLVSRAFASLPERWSAVLWHTEIEQCRPAEVALLLGISPNSVAALRYRAREGLRQAYLQMHLAAARAECQAAAGKLGAYVRGALSRRDARLVDGHLSQCGDCAAAHAELVAINQTMRGVLAPAILGGQAAAYLASGVAHGTLAAAAADGFRTGLGWLVRLWYRPVLPVAAGVAVAAIAVPTVTFLNPQPSPPGPAGAASPGAGGRAGLIAPVSRTSAGPVTPARPTPPGRSHPSAGPSGTGSPTPSRTPSPTGSPTPSPTRTPTPRPTGPRVKAELGVSVNVTGLLNLGVTDVVAVNVDDPGGAATGGLTASIGLPAGITLLGLASGSSGWTCSGLTCSHGPLAAGAASTVSLRILVATLNGCGKPVTASVVSGSLSAAGQSAATVSCGLL
jgi:RNA polymerase sigma factor (sigma-70 family)